MPTSTARPPESPAIRAILFENDQASREIAPGDLPSHTQVADSRLLWVDVVRDDGLPEAVAALGADPARLDPDAAGDLGLAVQGDWKYLHVRALNWRDGSRPNHVRLSSAYSS